MGRSEAAIQTSPAVSVVIPVLNEEKDIERLLLDLLAQDPPPGGFEVLVADGGSGDTTRDIVDRIAARDPRIRLIHNPGVLSSAGRNVGARQARGEYVLFLDGHCGLPRADYLVRMVEIFQATGAACLSRPQPLHELVENSWASDIALARHSWLGHYPRSDIFKSLGEVPGPTNPHSAGAAYRRRVLIALGGYDERFDACEDIEFNHRVHLAGEPAYFHPDLAVHYKPRSTLKEAFGQMQRYGRGRARLMARHPAMIPWPLVLASLPLLILVMAALFSRWTLGLYFLGLVIAVWSVTLVMQSLILGRGKARSVRIVAVFVILHLGAVLGFWRGVLEAPRFRVRGRRAIA